MFASHLWLPTHLVICMDAKSYMLSDELFARVCVRACVRARGCVRVLGWTMVCVRGAWFMNTGCDYLIHLQTKKRMSFENFERG